MRISSRNLCQKYGTDAVMLIHLEIVESGIEENNLCRATVSLDAWAYDSKGNDLGVSSSNTSSASSSSCIEAVQAVAQVLGYRAAKVFLVRLSNFGGKSERNVIIIETGTNTSGFD